MKIEAYLSILFLVGCTNADLHQDKDILNNTLKVSYKNLDNSLEINRTGLMFSNGEKAKSCNSYFLLNSKYSIEESVHNQLVKSEYLICEALDILIKSTSIEPKEGTDLNFGRRLKDQLDLRTFPSSLYRVSSKESHTLGSLFPKNSHAGHNIAELQTDEWTFILEVVALADVNDNSFSDWIVWVTDESKVGNYKSYSTIIIVDPDKQRKLEAMKYPVN
ncbi:hypothetical protein NQT63_08320 [Pseudoalteromonas agarivorans]|uniref:hypothetical protein n=1 Tax=Pseudoalteromonas TaxID=53246 RepID=UPI000F755530|nr:MULTISPECIES: hypothetical protein [Pseudoalteromonas]AZN34722.1 hypothetical protein EJ103_18660 [Pseudoalteromonas sp. Xi13]MCQ8885678.1 hypothetical protein [Pseudoalteromonas agarivorans]